MKAQPAEVRYVGLMTPATSYHRRSCLSSTATRRVEALNRRGWEVRDAEGFDECYRATSRRLLSYTYALTGDWAQSQDLVQEAYMRAWRQWGRISEYEDVEAWLRLVVSRLATDAWRRLGRWRRAMRLLGTSDDAQPPSEAAVLVARALRDLPPSQRQAMALHYLFDLPVAQIAADAGVPVNTVKSWLSRGRSTLATVLDPKEVICE